MNNIQNSVKFARLQLLQNQLQSHRIYSSVNDLQKLKVFMESHVFGVWDFMCLVKSLQKRLTCVEQIWIPVSSTDSARFINQIVLGEETDIHPDGKHYASHFEIYLNAMQEIGANTNIIREFVENVRAGKSPQKSLQNKYIPRHARDFVLNTLSSLNKPVCYIAGQFFYGREQPIPKMFQSLVKNLPQDTKCESFKYYLNRHIEVDGNEHGPMSAKIIAQLARKEDSEYKITTEGAINAIEHRIKLWDGVCQSLCGQSSTSKTSQKLIKSIST